MGGKHILRGLLGHAGKNRPTARQPYTGCARQVEKIITIKKHSEDLSAANDTKARIGNAEHGQGLVKGSAGGIPEKRVVVVGVACNCRDSPGQNQSFAQIRSASNLSESGMTPAALASMPSSETMAYPSIR